MPDLLKSIAGSRFGPTLEIRSLPSPVAGADLTIPATNGQDWRVLGVTATLTTSAAVANRTVRALVDDQTSVGASMPTGVTQVASTAVTYSWVGGLSFSGATPLNGFVALTLPDLILPTGWRFRTITGLLDAADQWSVVSIMIERLDEPPWREPMIGTSGEAALHDAMQALREQEMS